MSYLFDAFNNNAQTAAAADQTAGINAGVGAATPFYQQGISSLTGNYAQGMQPWQKLLQTGRAGTTHLENLLGIGPGGAGGGAGMLASLAATPGYQFALQQGDNSILAARAAGQGGGLSSGNTLLDLSKFNQGLATTTYQNAVNNAMPFLNTATTATGGLSSGYQNLGTQLNASYGNLGNMGYGAATSIGNANANADLGNLTASGNILGLGANLAGGLMKMASDIRVKEDVEPVGELADGQTVYRYRYIGDPMPRIGLIAQEVEEHAPEAVGDIVPGVLGVDYHRATDRAAALMRLAAANDDGEHWLGKRYTDELMRMAA
jgi:hypothetical protein